MLTLDRGTVNPHTNPCIYRLCDVNPLLTLDRGTVNPHTNTCIYRLCDVNPLLTFRGGYSRPSPYDILWVQLIFSPYYLVKYIVWFVKWVWRYNIKREDYDTEAKLHIIRKNMKMKAGQFDVSN